jgi:hypothetical protein
VVAMAAGCAARSAGPAGITPPNPQYQRVSALFPPFPDYIPGQGTLYVDPATLPAGPFAAYDKQGLLVASMYMIPIPELEAHKPFADLAAVPTMKPVRVEMYYHDVHPGVAEPHYHIVLWYVPPDQEPK